MLRAVHRLSRKYLRSTMDADNVGGLARANVHTAHT